MPTDATRLAAKARRALAALDSLIYDCEDPGTEALGARYELAQELISHPDPEAPAADQDAEALALLRNRIAAQFTREDAEHWGYDHGFSAKYGEDPETDAFVDIAVQALAPFLADRAAYRNQVLTEAAEIASTVIGPLWHLDTLHEICDRLQAARTASPAPSA
jgi:hypothetical protein